MDQRAELRDFLRTRRAKLRPEDVGLPQYGGARRVPGLRREEVAQLAGVSVDYYVRLEQGRGPNVSESVLDAVARALRLDHTEQAHLRNLAGPAKGRRSPARCVVVRPALAGMVEAVDSGPAMLLGRRLDILAWNRLYCAYFGELDEMPQEQRNSARLVFLSDLCKRSLGEDWQASACTNVGYLRLEAGLHPNDPQLSALIGELSIKSEEFRTLWAQHHVVDKTHGTKTLFHPLVGKVSYAYETFRLPGDCDTAMVVHTTEKGSKSEDANRLLASWSAEAADPRGATEPASRA